MTTLREAAQQALEVLEALQGGCTDSDDGTVEAITVWCPEIIDALKAALAEPQYPEIPWGKAIGVEQKRGCRVCGIGADGKAYGYVCSRSDCPTRVTCGGAA